MVTFLSTLLFLCIRIDVTFPVGCVIHILVFFLLVFSDNKTTKVIPRYLIYRTPLTGATPYIYIAGGSSEEELKGTKRPIEELEGDISIMWISQFAASAPEVTKQVCQVEEQEKKLKLETELAQQKTEKAKSCTLSDSTSS